MSTARGFASLLGEPAAQGTLEYALTVIALISVVLALGLLWRAGQDGTLARLAADAASHALDAGGAVDISLF